jgi:hypothetical protein
MARLKIPAVVQFQTEDYAAAHIPILFEVGVETRDIEQGKS